ncbi:unnamed protein product, partial [Choristocarpus tenellus]
LYLTRLREPDSGQVVGPSEMQDVACDGFSLVGLGDALYEGAEDLLHVSENSFFAVATDSASSSQGNGVSQKKPDTTKNTTGGIALGSPWRHADSTLNGACAVSPLCTAHAHRQDQCRLGREKCGTAIDSSLADSGDDGDRRELPSKVGMENEEGPTVAKATAGLGVTGRSVLSTRTQIGQCQGKVEAKGGSTDRLTREPCAGDDASATTAAVVTISDTSDNSSVNPGDINAGDCANMDVEAPGESVLGKDALELLAAETVHTHVFANMVFERGDVSQSSTSLPDLATSTCPWGAILPPPAVSNPGSTSASSIVKEKNAEVPVLTCEGEAGVEAGEQSLIEGVGKARDTGNGQIAPHGQDVLANSGGKTDPKPIVGDVLSPQERARLVAVQAGGLGVTGHPSPAASAHRTEVPPRRLKKDSTKAKRGAKRAPADPQRNPNPTATMPGGFILPRPLANPVNMLNAQLVQPLTMRRTAEQAALSPFTTSGTRMTRMTKKAKISNATAKETGKGQAQSVGWSCSPDTTGGILQAHPASASSSPPPPKEIPDRPGTPAALAGVHKFSSPSHGDQSGTFPEEGGEFSVDLDGSTSFKPRKIALRLVPRDEATKAKVTTAGYNPHLQIKTPLTKRIDAIFKHLVSKWKNVEYSDLANIRIIFEEEKHQEAQSRKYASGKGDGKASSQSLIWTATQSGEGLLALVRSLPATIQAVLFETEVLYLAYTFENASPSAPAARPPSGTGEATRDFVGKRKGVPASGEVEKPLVRVKKSHVQARSCTEVGLDGSGTRRAELQVDQCPTQNRNRESSGRVPVPPGAGAGDGCHSLGGRLVRGTSEVDVIPKELAIDLTSSSSFQSFRGLVGCGGEGGEEGSRDDLLPEPDQRVPRYAGGEGVADCGGWNGASEGKALLSFGEETRKAIFSLDEQGRGAVAGQIASTEGKSKLFEGNAEGLLCPGSLSEGFKVSHESRYQKDGTFGQGQGTGLEPKGQEKQAVTAPLEDMDVTSSSVTGEVLKPERKALSLVDSIGADNSFHRMMVEGSVNVSSRGFARGTEGVPRTKLHSQCGDAASPSKTCVSSTAVESASDVVHVAGTAVGAQSTQRFTASEGVNTSEHATASPGLRGSKVCKNTGAKAGAGME